MDLLNKKTHDFLYVVCSAFISWIQYLTPSFIFNMFSLRFHVVFVDLFSSCSTSFKFMQGTKSTKLIIFVELIEFVHIWLLAKKTLVLLLSFCILLYKVWHTNSCSKCSDYTFAVIFKQFHWLGGWSETNRHSLWRICVTGWNLISWSRRGSVLLCGCQRKKNILKEYFGESSFKLDFFRFRMWLCRNCGRFAFEQRA